MNVFCLAEVVGARGEPHTETQLKVVGVAGVGWDTDCITQPRPALHHPVTVHIPLLAPGGQAAVVLLAQLQQAARHHCTVHMNTATGAAVLLCSTIHSVGLLCPLLWPPPNPTKSKSDKLLQSNLPRTRT